MRLTHKKEDWYWKDEEFWLSAENPSLEKADEIYYKLAEFEDFMEEQGFESLVELKECIEIQETNIRFYSRISEENSNKNQALKARWEKLKEYIDKSIEADNKYLKSFPNNMNFENYRTTKRVILETMKELEK